MTALRQLFTEGFRIFFLAAGIYAVLGLLSWTLYLLIHATGGLVVDLSFSMPPHIWHGHEMIYGYAGAAIAGFLLTAVPNWTGTRPAGQAFLLPLFALWLAGRSAIWWSAGLPPMLVAAIDLAFVPALIVYLARQLWQKPKPQNVMFLVFLSLFWAGNLMMHAEWLGWRDDGAATGMRLGLLVLVTMIAVLGGRITPAFTRNAMQRAGVEPGLQPRSFKPVEMLAIGLTFALPLLTAIEGRDEVIGAVAIGAGALHLLRLIGWRTRWVLNQPILWALHLSLAMLALGLIWWGAALLGLASEVAGLHILGIGAVGGMTLAVMSRAVLGHSGRALVASGPVVTAYLLIAVGAVLRALASELTGDFYFPLILMSGLIWIAGYTCFIVTILPDVLRPRAHPASA